MRLVLTLSFLSLLSIPLHAQFQGRVFVEDSLILVKHTTNLSLPWAGGTSNPQPSMADLNRDGLNDLVIYEWSTGQVKTFINMGTIANPNFVYTPKYARNFPTGYGVGISDYLIMEDYNRDGIMDLFHKGPTGFRVLRGYWNANNELAFTYYTDLKFQSPTFGLVSAYCQTSDIPGIADVDGDGDLDFFAYSVLGAHISFYKNCQVEHGLPKDSIQICNPSSCWGQTTQYFDRTFAFGATNCNLQGLFNCKTTLHAGNCLTLLDIDGDGDMDMLDGNISFPDIQLLINGKVQANASRDTMVAQDTTWQSRVGGRVYRTDTWPAATYLDVDCDGKKDILISPHAQGISENVKNMAYYRNVGTAATPNFVFQSDAHIVGDMMDFGTGSYPVVYDYNKDGRPDLIVGSDGYHAPNGTLISRLVYYENKLVNGRTTLVKQNDDLLSMSTQNFQGAAPAIGDVDNDGKDDLILGHTDGSLSFYKNISTSANVQPNWQLTNREIKDGANTAISVGYYAAPFIYDLDKDGKKDMLIGHQGGTVFFYKNAGSTGQLKMTYVTDSLGKMVADKKNPYSGFSVPYVGRLDNTNTEYILLGNDSGFIHRYTGFQNGNVTGVYTTLDSQYSSITTGLRSAIAVGDLDGNGIMDLIVGNVHGGLNLYRQDYPVSVVERGKAGSLATRLFPNPAQEEIQLAWDQALSVAVTCSMYDATGRMVLVQQIPAGSFTSNVSLAGFSNGVYQCLINGNGVRSVQKFVILK